MKVTLQARVGLAVALVLVAFASRDAAAGAPTEQFRHYADRALEVLGAADLQKASATEERRAELRRTASDAFDFGEMTKRTLARHWQVRTPAEREEFIALFVSLLEHAYLGKIELYRGEKVSYVGESIDGDQATVRTRIVTKQGAEVPVDYRMHRRGDRWLVYDVAVEGISLVGNYRTQFDRIIRRSSYTELVAKLRSKEFPVPEAASAKGPSRDGQAR
ncbi:MAG: ABC transporter substrate-binding protein [Candidatus Rokubacteria bacterium]|nr:ABC transporter substrate-binding protein [Candidatus Rokubacteria bacterium]